METQKKQCFKCKEWKSPDDFYVHNQMADGHLGKCKKCAKKDATNHRNANIERVRAYDRERGKLPHNIAKQMARNKIFRKLHPIKYASQTLVNNAVRDGRLKKPGKCSKCDKKGMICGHHEDYYKPLDVIWVCQACHVTLHKEKESV